MKNSKGETNLVPKRPDVIILYAQWDFGKGGGYQRTLSSYKDTHQERERWFQQCLDELGQCDSCQNLAFPYKIGCGLAGGNWDRYLPMIKNFAVKYKQEAHGSHRSPEKQFKSINTYDYIITLI